MSYQKSKQTEHNHTFRTAFKATTAGGALRYFVYRICIVKGCEFKECIDLVKERPGGEK